jgi:hypothetical protein
MTEPGPSQLSNDERLSRLVEAWKDYEQHTPTAYDEGAARGGERANAAGSVGKLDIDALLFWSGWEWTLADMQVVTTRAVDAARNEDVPTVGACTARGLGAGRAAER